MNTFKFFLLLVISMLLRSQGIAQVDTKLEIYLMTKIFSDGEVKWTQTKASAVIWKLLSSTPHTFPITPDYNSGSVQMPGHDRDGMDFGLYGFDWQPLLFPPPDPDVVFSTIAYGLYKISVKKININQESPFFENDIFFFIDYRTCDDVTEDINIDYNTSNGSLQYQINTSDWISILEGDTLKAWEFFAIHKEIDFNCFEPTVPTGLTAAADPNSFVKIDWEASEPEYSSSTGGAKYHIWRKKNSSPWQKLTSQKLTVTTYTDQFYTIPGSNNMQYKVKAYSGDGTLSSAFSDPVSIQASAGFNMEENISVSTIKPSLYISNLPNPFNPSTELVYMLPEAGNVLLTIYDVRGKEVSRLIDGWRNKGRHTVVWDGTDHSSGVYFYLLRTNSGTVKSKMLLLK